MSAYTPPVTAEELASTRDALEAERRVHHGGRDVKDWKYFCQAARDFWHAMDRPEQPTAPAPPPRAEERKDADWLRRRSNNAGVLLPDALAALADAEHEREELRDIRDRQLRDRHLWDLELSVVRRLVKDAERRAEAAEKALEKIAQGGICPMECPEDSLSVIECDASGIAARALAQGGPDGT